ncbi:MAG: sulfatase-like hydrolase/transferase [Armatimonadota bacterium]
MTRAEGVGNMGDGGRMSRREAIQRMALAAAGVGLGVSRGAWSQQRRPNIVMILTDDQRWDAMSNMPNRWPFLQTPNIDRLASEGARFENAFVTISLCSPSRACFLTGRHAHSHGVRTNEGTDVPPDMPTYPQVLQRAGYRTAFVGKWHMARSADPRPGFDYWLSFVGQGQYTDPPLQENHRAFQAQGYMTDILTDYAVRWLQRQDGPFCLVLSHKAAHGPFTPAPRHRDAFPDAEIPPPASFFEDFADKPAWLRRAMAHGARQDNRDQPAPESLPPPEWDPTQATRLDYLRCMLGIDDSVGRVLETLADIGELDNTLVAFAGDNGYFMGEHRRGDKRLAYEESMRIPLLMRYPALIEAGARIEAMALNIDLAPTLLELAGAQVPAGMHGRSLIGPLQGREAGWRDRFFYQYYQERWLPGLPTILAVRTDRWKYITCPDLDDIDELYDLRHDPHEMTNLALAPEHAGTLAQMRAALEELKRETGYTPPPEHVFTIIEAPAEQVLLFTFEDDEGDRVVDASGKGNHGRNEGSELVETERGTARRFSGEEHISVPKSESLDPTRRAFTITATVRPEAEDGVVLARGGQSHGYALLLRDGRPELVIRAGGAVSRAAGEARLDGGWVTITAMLGEDLQMMIWVDGEEVARAEAHEPVYQDPNEEMQVGADGGTSVADTPSPGFVGLIEQIGIHRGEAPPG